MKDRMVADQIPFHRSLLWILLSTLLISGSAFTGWLYYLHIREKRLQDEQYRIVAIIQSTPQTDALKTVYLAELLSLSLDRPVNLYQFNTQEATQRLLHHPLIKTATMKKILPGTLFIHYEMRIPKAYIGDFSNTAVDEEGFLFPFSPFFTPKKLPVIYLGLTKEECKWGSRIPEHGGLKLAFNILQQFQQLQQQDFVIQQVDVSQAQADSYGQRQIVIVLEETSLKPATPLVYVRLNGDHYAQGLANLCTLQSSPAKVSLDAQPVIIDLRIPHLAFIKSGR